MGYRKWFIKEYDDDEVYLLAEKEDYWDVTPGIPVEKEKLSKKIWENADWGTVTVVRKKDNNNLFRKLNKLIKTVVLVKNDKKFFNKSNKSIKKVKNENRYR